MEDYGTTSKGEGTSDFRCVQCGFFIKTLYIQYSPGNIRLMRCVIHLSFTKSICFYVMVFISNVLKVKTIQGNCKAVADEYIECEVMVVEPKLNTRFSSLVLTSIFLTVFLLLLLISRSS